MLYPLGFCTLTLTQVLDRYTVIEIYRVFSQINQGTPSSRHYFTIFRDRTSIWALKRIGPRTIEGKERGGRGDGFHCRAFIYERRFFSRRRILDDSSRYRYYPSPPPGDSISRRLTRLSRFYDQPILLNGIPGNANLRRAPFLPS